MVEWVGRVPNIVVLRSLSKRGLAALRIGGAIADREVASELDKGRLPYNVDAYAQLAGTYLLETQGAQFSEHVRATVAERKRLEVELSKQPRVCVYPSSANFLLLQVPRAEASWRALFDRGVLVQRFGAPDSISSCLRVTVGTRDENDRFLQAFSEALAA
jgi:histidinol-phosphate aminotransferase